MKAIINGKIILPNEIVENKILLFDNKILNICDSIPREYEYVEIIDAKGKYVSPGLIDIHIHGNVGYDFMNTSLFENTKIEKSIASKGVTGYLMTTMTMSKEKIHSALKSARFNINNKNENVLGAKPLGVHLEGPFLNEIYKGAQDPDFIIAPSFELIEEYKDIIKVITYAPEKDINLEFTKYIRDNTDIVLSMGHTNATYDEAVEAFSSGAKHATHLFNAMTGLNHRNPGVVGACLLNDGFKCELIVDNIHFNKDLCKLIVKSKKLEDIILVTDAMEAGNMPDGTYSIGGHPVKVESGSARLVSNGALAGSVLNLNTAVKNFYENTSLKLNEVIQLASLNPAKSLGLDALKGSLEVGKDADIVIFDETMECYMTFVEGEAVYKKINL
ncbi:MAG: N-acetylglucosamine-6-phosphate deacetylase [Clostridium sp.]|nr:N-acetylglucosamine-6-phosphate deacetylase [Clostridium sp.]MBQ9000173.1 N-acetylglucosamine-6-phosphate deacetylase [Clostridium sp.]